MALTEVASFFTLLTGHGIDNEFEKFERKWWAFHPSWISFFCLPTPLCAVIEGVTRVLESELQSAPENDAAIAKLIQDKIHQASVPLIEIMKQKNPVDALSVLIEFMMNWIQWFDWLIRWHPMIYWGLSSAD